MCKLAVSTVAGVLLAAALIFPASAADVVTAVKVDKPPVLTAGAADPAWAKAKALTVPLAGGMNFKNGSTTATIKAVYSRRHALHAGAVQRSDPVSAPLSVPEAG